MLFLTYEGLMNVYHNTNLLTFVIIHALHYTNKELFKYENHKAIYIVVL